MPACKWRFSALPVLTCMKHAARRFSKNTIFGSPTCFKVHQATDTGSGGMVDAETRSA
jgi:hypothetical protein